MKVFVKRIAEALLIIFVCLIIGIALLSLVYLMPIDNIEKNIILSAKTLSEEGMYPHLFSWCTSRLDNSTDSIMLLEAVCDVKDTLINRILLVYRGVINNDAQFYSLIDKYVNNVNYDSYETYARYWHGYLVILKPLLLFFSYSQIRILNGIVQLVLNLIICFLLKKNKKSSYIMPYVISMLVIMPICLACSLQFSSCFYISTIFSIAVLYITYKKKGVDWHIFLLSGVCLAYFDFLTYPIATLGLPLLMYLITRNKTGKDLFRDCLIFSFYWLFGYGVMWLSKWLLASLLTNQNVIFNAIESVMLRTSNVNTNNESITIFSTLYKNISKFIKTPFILLCVIYILCIITKIKHRKLIIKVYNILPFIYIMLLPIVWYIVISNHSYIHSYFTNKALLISLLSLLFSFNYVYSNNKQ